MLKGPFVTGADRVLALGTLLLVSQVIPVTILISIQSFTVCKAFSIFISTSQPQLDRHITWKMIKLPMPKLYRLNKNPWLGTGFSLPSRCLRCSVMVENHQFTSIIPI